MKDPLRLGVITILLTVIIGLTACGQSAAATQAQAAGIAPQQSAILMQATDVADGVLAELKTKGLPVGDSFTFSVQTDPNHLLGTPGQYDAKVSFQDTRVPVHVHGAGITVIDGGTIEVFGNLVDASQTRQYMDSLNQDNALFFNEYDSWHGVVLLRISTQLDPAQAAQYKSAFDATPVITAITPTGPLEH